MTVDGRIILRRFIVPILLFFVNVHTIHVCVWLIVIFSTALSGNLISDRVEQLAQVISQLRDTWTRVYTERGSLAGVEFLVIRVRDVISQSDQQKHTAGGSRQNCCSS